MAIAKKSTTAVASLVSTDVLTEKFKYIASKIAELEKSSLELKVDSDETLVIAENNTSISHGLIKEIDALRVNIKAPYAETVKVIDSYCKTVSANAERLKIRFASEVAKFKTIKEAQLKAEAEAKMKEVRAAEEAKTEESSKLVRIREQLTARIYGGTFRKKDGTSVPVAGCMNAEQCKSLEEWITKSVPPISDFKYFPTEYEDMLLSIKSKLAQHASDLIDLEKNDYPSATEGAMRRINESRALSEVENNETKELLGKKIEKEIKGEVRSITNEISAAGKGIRSRVVFDAIPERELEVPRDFLSLDSTKVNAYINDNREKIESDIKEGKETVPGLKFSFDTKFVTR